MNSFTSSSTTTIIITLLLICFVFLNRFVEGTQKSCNVLDYGAKGDGRTLDTNAIQHAIAKCDTVLLPAEYKFLSAPFNLTSNQIFVVNGILLATTDPSLWPVVAPLPSYPKPVENFGNMTLRYGAFIGIFNSKNITITGTGTIDGQGFIWWERSGRLPGHKDTLKHTRGRLIEPMYSSDIVIKGITILNAPFWTIHLYVCDNVLIEGVIIAAPIYSRNTDCIDPDSSTNVYIRNCTLSGGDDQIAIKSGQDKAGRLFGKPSINITVDNIRVPHGDGISIGSEMSGGIYNIVVKIITKLDPKKLFLVTKNIEKKLGRKKKKVNSPRICDIDILDYKGLNYKFSINNDKLIIPHPRLHNRNFVLFPLFEIEKNWKHPLKKTKIHDLIGKLDNSSLYSIKQI